MVQGSKTPSADIKLNKMVCLNYNTKFFDSDVHMCDQESENVDIVNDFKNKLCPLEHRCTFVMKSGSYCFSKLHSHAQHVMYWDMTSFDVQRAYDVGAITNNELTQINKLHEEKDCFHHEILLQCPRSLQLECAILPCLYLSPGSVKATVTAAAAVVVAAVVGMGVML